MTKAATYAGQGRYRFMQNRFAIIAFATVLCLPAPAIAQAGIPSASELARNAAEAARNATESTQNAFETMRERIRGNSSETIIIEREAPREAEPTPQSAQADTAPVPQDDPRDDAGANEEPATASEADVAQSGTDDEDGVPLPRQRPDATRGSEDAATSDVNPTTERSQALDTAEPEAGAATDAEAETEPDRIYQAACPAVLSGMVEGEIMPPVSEDNQCGLQSPYGVTGFNIGDRHIGLSQSATLNCQMATAMAQWAGRVSAYTEAVFNSPVTEIGMGTSYYCRPRNNQAGADISEHGFGNAADITGFKLADGRQIDLPENWPESSDPDSAARTMWHAHDTACGYFTTVLGPEANALHENHLHLDLGCHGQSCTARICE